MLLIILKLQELGWRPKYGLDEALHNLVVRTIRLVENVIGDTKII